MKLFRAANTKEAKKGACFAARMEDAECYLDNPGFGGNTLYQINIEAEYVLHLGSIRETLEEIEKYNDDEYYGDQFNYNYQVVEKYRAEFSKKYDWVVYTDDYPHQCETWSYLGDKTLICEKIEN